MSLLKRNIVLVPALALSLAACAKHIPEQLPPPPPAAAPAPAPPPVQNTPIPGSRADFLAQAGSDTIHFGTDKYDIDADSRAILSRQVEWLKKYPNVTALIEGHCDERGTREYNLALGDRRANAAKNFLIDAGIAASRLSTISYGKERPVASGSNEAAWAQNRRAVTVVPQ